jgi:hypothetical protein
LVKVSLSAALRRQPSCRPSAADLATENAWFGI